MKLSIKNTETQEDSKDLPPTPLSRRKLLETVLHLNTGKSNERDNGVYRNRGFSVGERQEDARPHPPRRQLCSQQGGQAALTGVGTDFFKKMMMEYLTM